MKALLDKPVAFHAALARLFGGIEEAIYWQQLNYWSDKGKREDGFIYKTKNDIQDETTLTRDQQDRVRKKLEKAGYLETKILKANRAPTVHYRVNIDAVMEALTKDSKSGKPTNRKAGNPLIQDKRETHESITENTTESTTDTSEAGASQDQKSKHNPLGGEIIKAFEEVDPKNKTYYGNTAQRKACDFLLAEYGLEEVLKRIQVLPKTNKIIYFPHITTAVQLRDRWVDLQDAVDKKRSQHITRKPEMI